MNNKEKKERNKDRKKLQLKNKSHTFTKQESFTNGWLRQTKAL
jgi:hypothetical protein